MNRLIPVTMLLAISLGAQIPAPPGKLIDMGGRKMHINCTGAGSPELLPEAFEDAAEHFGISEIAVKSHLANNDLIPRSWVYSAELV